MPYIICLETESIDFFTVTKSKNAVFFSPLDSKIGTFF